MFENGMDLWTFYKPNGKEKKQGKMVNGKRKVIGPFLMKMA